MLQTTGKDYYDIPENELPSANFAARPTSEISELSFLDIDGLSTSTSFTLSSNGNTDDGDDINDGPTSTALAQELPVMHQPKMPSTPPDTPAITVTSPSRRQSLRQRLRSVSDVASLMRRPSMRRKADTAPPGAFSSPDYAPQVPRRAMSARFEKRDGAIGRHSRHLSSESDLKARTVLGVDKKFTGEERAKPTDSSEESDHVEQYEEMDLSQPKASFSRKPRVRKH